MKLRGHMKEHIRIHTQEKAVGCPQCGGMFASKTKFSDHIVRQKAEAAQIFHCQVRLSLVGYFKDSSAITITVKPRNNEFQGT